MTNWLIEGQHGPARHALKEELLYLSVRAINRGIQAVVQSIVQGLNKTTPRPPHFANRACVGWATGVNAFVLIRYSGTDFCSKLFPENLLENHQHPMYTQQLKLSLIQGEGRLVD